MKVMICGSLSFAKEMVMVRKDLEKLGHIVLLPTDIDLILSGAHNHDNLDADYIHMIKNDILGAHFNNIRDSDAILVLNYSKNGVVGYIGASVMMELGVAYHLKKKIFLLNNLPSHNDSRWALEVSTIKPIIINGDLSIIK